MSESIEQSSHSLLALADEEFEAFDWTVYGAIVKSTRKRIGYKTAQSFSDTIWRRTRVTVSRDSVYKIEQGRQIPDALQFMAINIALFQDPFPDKQLGACYCIEWGDLLDHDGQIPEEWAVQNYEAAIGNEADDPNFTIDDAIERTGEKPEVFIGQLSNQ